MKKIIGIWLFAVLFWMLIFSSLAFSQTGQNTARWDLYSGKWDLFTAYADSSTNDTLYFNYLAGADSVFWSEGFKTWPFMAVQAIVVDKAVTTDSFKFIVDFYQSGEGFLNVVATRFTRVKTLGWQSTSSYALVDTVTAAGRWAANITDEPINPHRWGRLRIRCFTGNKKLPSQEYCRFIVNGWNDK